MVLESFVYTIGKKAIRRKQNTMRCGDGVLTSGAVFIDLVCLDTKLQYWWHQKRCI